MHLAASAIVTRRTTRHIVAENYFGSLRYPIQHKFNNSEQHARAAMALVEKLAIQWRNNGLGRAGLELINSPYCGQWIAGDMPKGDGYAFTYAGETNRTSGIEPRGFVQNCETNGKK